MNSYSVTLVTEVKDQPTVQLKDVKTETLADLRDAIQSEIVRRQTTSSLIAHVNGDLYPHDTRTV